MTTATLQQLMLVEIYIPNFNYRILGSTYAT